jgi:hypothetical protein
MKDVLLEPNPKTVFGGSIPKIERIRQVLDWRMLAMRVSSDKL